MVTIIMQGANIKNQYIAETMSFDDVQPRNDLIGQFKQLKSGLHQAIMTAISAVGLLLQ